MGVEAARPRPASCFLTERPHVPAVVLAAGCLALVSGLLAVLDPRLALAAVAGGALVAAVLCRPYWGGVILVALVPAASGLAPGVLVPGLRLSEVLIGIVSLCLFTAARRRDHLPFDCVDWLLLTYGTTWAFFGVLAAGGHHLSVAQWGTVAGQLQFFLVYRGVRSSVRTPEERRGALAALVVAASLVSLLAIAQEVHAPGVAGLLGHLTGGVDGAQNGSLQRATGSFDNWAALAGYLVPVLFISASLALSRRRAALTPAQLGAIGVITVALLATREISAILCVLAGVSWLAATSRRRRNLVAVGAAVGLGTLLASPLLVARLESELAPTPGLARARFLPQTIAFRIGVWSQYLRAIAHRLFEGYGVLLPPSVAWPFPESQYVALLAEGGIAMLLVFALLGVALIRLCWLASTSSDAFDAALGRGLLAAAVALVLLDAIWPYFSNGGLPQVFCAVLALGAPAWQRAPRDGPIAVPPPLTALSSVAP